MVKPGRVALRIVFVSSCVVSSVVGRVSWSFVLLKSTSHPTLSRASEMQQVANVRDDLVGIFGRVEVVVNNA